ncbi:MAG: hypothetical protein V7739_04675 [Motiliproteus sp.]
MQLITLTPIRSHLNLKVGVNEQSTGYKAFLESLVKAAPLISVQKFRNEKAYEKINEDDRNTLCLFRLKQDYPEQKAKLEVQVYSNCMSVVAIQFHLDEVNDARLEERVQHTTTELISRFYRETLYPLLKTLPTDVQPSYLEPVGQLTGFADMNKPFAEDNEVEQLWTARLMRLKGSEVKGNATLIKHWLSNTPCPEDADDIIRGDKDHALSWLNYVLVEQEERELEYMLEAMCLAQYVYAVQDVCNTHLYRAISDTYLENNTRSAEKILDGIRAITRMHYCSYQQSLKYFKRNKKDLLEEILAGWDFDKLSENSNRLLDICSSRLKDIHTSRSEKSTFYTDLILVGIGFVSLFDLAISLSEYSRAYTSSAILGYRDLEPSGFLTEIASWETDSLLMLSVATIVLLLGGYWYAKNR